MTYQTGCAIAILTLPTGLTFLLLCGKLRFLWKDWITSWTTREFKDFALTRPFRIGNDRFQSIITMTNKTWRTLFARVGCRIKNILPFWQAPMALLKFSRSNLGFCVHLISPWTRRQNEISSCIIHDLPRSSDAGIIRTKHTWILQCTILEVAAKCSNRTLLTCVDVSLFGFWNLQVKLLITLAGIYTALASTPFCRGPGRTWQACAQTLSTPYLSIHVDRAECALWISGHWLECSWRTLDTCSAISWCVITFLTNALRQMGTT